MNEQLQKALADILMMLQKSAETVGSAAQTEVPLLVQEYLRWGTTQAAVWAALWFVICGVMLYAANRTRKWDVHKYDPGFTTLKVLAPSYVAKLAFAYFFLPGAAILSALAAVEYAMTLLQIIVAPRVYLLETVIEAIK